MRVDPSQLTQTMNFNIFGISEAEITTSGFTSLTIFGGTELRRQTVAERIMRRRAGGGRKPGLWERLVGRDRPLAITVCGITTIVSPTIIEEYSAVRSLLDSGTITVEECRALVGSLASPDSREEITMVTLFGGCGFETVSEKKQRKALDLAERSGAISSRTRGELEQAIGCPDRAATGIVARAAMA